MDTLIGKSLAQAEERLRKESIPYEIIEISGGKDEELLQELHVVRIRDKKDYLELVVTGFKTSI